MCIARRLHLQLNLGHALGSWYEIAFGAKMFVLQAELWQFARSRCSAAAPRSRRVLESGARLRSLQRDALVLPARTRRGHNWPDTLEEGVVLAKLSQGASQEFGLAPSRQGWQVAGNQAWLVDSVLARELTGQVRKRPADARPAGWAWAECSLEVIGLEFCWTRSRILQETWVSEIAGLRA